MKEIKISDDDGFLIHIRENLDRYVIVCPYDVYIEIDGEDIIPNDNGQAKTA